MATFTQKLTEKAFTWAGKKGYLPSRIWRAMNIGNTWADYSRWDKERLIVQGYERNPAFFFAANLVAEITSSVPVYVEYEVKGRKEQTYSHPILNVLEMGSDAWRERLKLSILYEIVTGEAFDQIVMTSTLPRPRPLGLIVMPSQYTDPIRGDYRQPIIGFRYNEFGNEVFSPDEVIMYKLPSLSEYFHGMSPGIPLAETLDLNNFATTWNKNVAMKGGVPPVYARIAGDEAEAARTQAWWQSQRGANRSADLMVLPDTLSELKKLNETPHDAEWSQAYIISLRAILMALGVSSSLANDAANKTYSNYQEARKALYQEVAIPHAERRYAKITRALSKYYADNPKICVDKDKIDAIGEDRMIAARRVSMLVKDRILTPKQAAEELGYTYEVDDTKAPTPPDAQAPNDAQVPTDQSINAEEQTVTLTVPK